MVDIYRPTLHSFAMNNIFNNLPISPVAFENNIDRSTDIFDAQGNFCGFLENQDKSKIVAYDNLGRFSGYFISNRFGNTEKYDSIGNFSGFIVADSNLVKYDKT